MKVGDKVFYYHSGAEKAVVGMAKVYEGRIPGSHCQGRAVGCGRTRGRKGREESGNFGRDKANKKLADMKLGKAFAAVGLARDQGRI
jgi:hypothetical protein